ncbi:MAG: ATP-dependent DNA helicase [Candidatus Paceibacterota bacterium]|jgi:DNA helicase-2/ATP-dependent DNA helicase PcrA
MITEEFKQAYKRLNKAQKEAVDTIEGPVMVAAGPGTGKTQILALRIANILLETDTEPENILAITFTESGVLSMRRRLAEIIGTPAYAVAINTFHGFCNDIIKEEPESFPNIIGATNITEVEQIKILEEILAPRSLGEVGLRIKELSTRNDPFYYLRAILSSINELKREGISPENFQTEIKKSLTEFEEIPDLYNDKGKYAGQMKSKYADELKRLKKNEELGKIYEEYQNKLREQKAYDYQDMIMEVAMALEQDSALLLKLQEQYQYILVDEHQDTNNAQNKVLELLASYFENPNLFVVGDDKQAIFRFQGASLENFLYFKKKYPEAKFIVLEENYRSSQNILDVADSLLAGDKKLKSKAVHKDEPIDIYEFSTPEVEEYFIAEDIKAKIKKGAKPEQVAVFYRDNRDVFAIAKALERAGVPVAIESDQDILGDNDLRKLITIFRAVEQVGDEKLFVETLHLDFLNFEPLDIYKLTYQGYKEKTSVLDLAQNSPIFKDWYQKYISLAKIAKNESLTESFEQIVRESGFLNYLLAKPETVEKIDKLNGLFDEAKSLIERHREGKMADFIAYLDLLTTHDILLKKGTGTIAPGRVRLMTAHKSKGLEFDHVYIVYAYDGHWGNKKRRDLIKLPWQKAEGNDDERRLFYVALTRARQTVIITYSRTDTNKRELLPSQFIGELRADLVEKKGSAKYEKELADHREILFAPRETHGASVKDKEFVRELFRERGLAVTHLNNYLKCPWNYFYTNLLRLPKAQEPHLMYGNAVHGALQDFFNKFGGDEDPDKAFLLARFEDGLNRQPLTARDYGELLERGEKALGGYYDFWEGQWRTRVLTEFNIPGVILPALSGVEGTPDIRLTGKIDKMEFLGDGGEVNVVDYKTGKPKTRGYVEGSTKNSEGDIKRQIVFYKLLLDNYADNKYKMVSATVDFVEPDDKGKYKQENFTVMREEEEELIALIKKVSAEILNLDFWDKSCDDKDCEFCSLRAMMTK